MLIQGDAALIPFLDKTFHCVVTSPPYWGLRKYTGKQGRIWGGDHECEHEWGEKLVLKTGNKPTGIQGKGTIDRRNKDELPHSQFCQLCNAWYGGLGLEPTPELHIEHMVEIFREIRRVLRDDGCVWLNYGDCYATSPAGNLGDRNPFDGGRFKANKPFNVTAVKQGNLMLMPHKVAIALQRPYYIGRIKNEIDRVWLAAMVEADGCIYIQRRPAGQKAGKYIRKNDTYTPGLEVANTNSEIPKRCASISNYVGGTSKQTPEQNPRRDHTIYRWTIRGNQCRNILKEIYPYLVTESKKAQARISLGSPTSGEKAKRSWDSVKKLHNRIEPTIDFPPPKKDDLWEPGWIVRNDAVWSKSNPMPESVAGWRWERNRKLIGEDPRGNEGDARNATLGKPPQRDHDGREFAQPEYEYGDDYVLRKGSWRHTRAHEYIFQLTKKMNYYSNQEAVREIYTEPINRWGGDKLKEESEKHSKYLDMMGISPSSALRAGRPLRPNSSGRNPRSVLDVPTAPYKGAHYATFPPNLIAPLIRASCPKRCCPECGAPWAPVVDKSVSFESGSGKAGNPPKGKFEGSAQALSGDYDIRMGPVVQSNILDYRPTCSCERDDHIPGIVLDPFIGSGTTGAVARELGRRWIGLDISMEYLDQQAKIRALKWTPSNALEGLPLFMDLLDE